jgi:hypothetical protein
MQQDPLLVTNDEDTHSPCPHWVAATAIQKRARGWLYSLCYKELQKRKKESFPRCRCIYMAKVIIALRLQGRWRKGKSLNKITVSG